MPNDKRLRTRMANARDAASTGIIEADARCHAMICMPAARAAARGFDASLDGRRGAVWPPGIFTTGDHAFL